MNIINFFFFFLQFEDSKCNFIILSFIFTRQPYLCETTYTDAFYGVVSRWNAKAI